MPAIQLEFSTSLNLCELDSLLQQMVKDGQIVKDTIVEERSSKKLKREIEQKGEYIGGGGDIPKLYDIWSCSPPPRKMWGARPPILIKLNLEHVPQGPPTLRKLKFVLFYLYFLSSFIDI